MILKEKLRSLYIWYLDLIRVYWYCFIEKLKFLYIIQRNESTKFHVLHQQFKFYK